MECFSLCLVKLKNYSVTEDGKVGLPDLIKGGEILNSAGDSDDDNFKLLLNRSGNGVGGFGGSEPILLAEVTVVVNSSGSWRGRWIILVLKYWKLSGYCGQHVRCLLGIVWILGTMTWDFRVFDWKGP